MSIGVGTPPVGTPAFAVSSDASGVLIARRDNTLGRFAVSMAGDALELSARPVVPSLWNLCPNPRFAVNVTDGWAATGVVTRVTTTPYGLPDGFDAAAQLVYESSGTFACYREMPAGVARKTYLAADFHVLTLAPNSYVQFAAWVGEDVLASDVYYPEPGAWVWRDMFLATPTMPTSWRLALLVPISSDTAAEASFIAGVRVTPYDAGDLEYRDGDSPGWAWTGVHHNSESRGNG